MNTTRDMTACPAMSVGALLSAGLLLAACGSSTPPPEDQSSTEDYRGSSGRGPSIGMSAEIGALDVYKVDEAFEQALPKLSGCFADGVGRISYLSGHIEFEIRVGDGGSARVVVIKDSSLGDRKTELCMMNTLLRASWPAPEGGDEGIAAKSFTFDPSEGTRQPVEWSSGDLGEGLEEARSALQSCQSESGAGPMKATLYVDTDGKPEAVGVSASDERGNAAADCVVDALMGVTFPSPGSWSSKASFVIN